MTEISKNLFEKGDNLETNYSVEVREMDLSLFYSMLDNRMNLQFHFEDCILTFTLTFTIPIKIKKGATLLSVTFSHKPLESNANVNLRLIEKFDRKSTIGFDMSILDSKFRQTKCLNGLLAGFYGLEFNVLSPTKKQLIILGYQKEYVSAYAYEKGETLETFQKRHEKINKQKPNFFVQKTKGLESALNDNRFISFFAGSSTNL